MTDFNPNLFIPDIHGIAPQWSARPTFRDAAVIEVKRRQMTWTAQTTFYDATKTKIGLFMRAGPFTCHDAVTVPYKQQIDPSYPNTKDSLVSKLAQRQDLHPSRISFRHSLRSLRHQALGATRAWISAALRRAPDHAAIN
jgi:hypothetical protein